MTKILYDNQIFKIQDFGGISRYFSELMNGVNSSRDFDFVPRSFYSANEHLRNYALTRFDWFLNSRRFRGKVRLENYFRRNEDKKILKLAETGDYNIYHPTYYDPLLLDLVPRNRSVIVTVYDMIHEVYLKDIEIPAFKKQLFSRATKIIAISQNTKNDILHLFPEIDEAKIKVVYLASSLKAVNVEAKMDLPAKYILFVGNRWTYKNFTWFVRSIASYLKKEKLTLLCAGAGQFTESEYKLFHELDLNNNVRYVPVRNDAHLVALYKQACCFVFPSLYEGFGIPVLEAFSCRCPVVLSNASCFPEIASDAALYFNPDVPESLVEQISRVIGNGNVAESLKEAGIERNKLYGWEKTVKQHLEIYASVNPTS